MLCRLYKEKKFIKPVVIDNNVRVLRSFDSVASNGCLSKRSEYVDVSVSSMFGSFTASDFAIANVVMTGAIDKLQDVSFRNNSYTSVSEQLDDLMSSKSE